MAFCVLPPHKYENENDMRNNPRGGDALKLLCRWRRGVKANGVTPQKHKGREISDFEILRLYGVDFEGREMI